MSCNKEEFARTVNELDDGLNHASMTDCENYGMTWGCDIDCPVLRRDECELQEAENKELYELMLEESGQDELEKETIQASKRGE